MMFKSLLIFTLILGVVQAKSFARILEQSENEEELLELLGELLEDENDNQEPPPPTNEANEDTVVEPAAPPFESNYQENRFPFETIFGNGGIEPELAKIPEHLRLQDNTPPPPPSRPDPPVNKNDNQESSPNQPPFNAVGKAQYSFESIFGDGGIEPEPASLDKIPEFPPAQDNTPPPPQALDAIQEDENNNQDPPPPSPSENEEELLELRGELLGDENDNQEPPPPTNEADGDNVEEPAAPPFESNYQENRFPFEKMGGPPPPPSLLDTPGLAGIQNGGIQNGGIQNGGIQNGGIQNGEIQNGEIQNGGIQNTDSNDGEIGYENNDEGIQNSPAELMNEQFMELLIEEILNAGKRSEMADAEK